MGRKSAKIANKKGAADKLKSQVYTKALLAPNLEDLQCVYFHLIQNDL
jgi:hypothetical protein